MSYYSPSIEKLIEAFERLPIVQNALIYQTQIHVIFVEILKEIQVLYVS